MKHVKKLFAFALTLVMALAVALPAFADEATPATGTTGTTGNITIDNAIKDETYTLYKVFEATATADRTDGGEGIAYKSDWLTTGNDYFAVDSKGNITIKNAGKNADGTLSNNAIEWLKSQVSNFDKIGEPVKATGSTVEWSGLEPGYYYIDTTTGSFVTVDSITPNVTVKEKNIVTTEDKKQSATEGSYSDAQLDLNIGDTVYYDVDIKVGKGADQDVTLVDELSDGLTLNQNSIAVKVNGEDVDATNYTLTTGVHGFTLVLDDAYVATLSANTVVAVTYNALINEGAVIRDENTNTATLTYSEQNQTDSTTVKTYDFVVKKFDGSNNFLDGAGFKLYDAQTDGNQIKVTEDATGYYVDKDGSADTQIMVDSANGVNVHGLKPGTYWLEETTTPNGYNTLTARQQVVITKDATNAVEVKVVNNVGTEMPSTGGIGTTIFYVVGGVMVAGAVVFLLTKRRAAAAE